MEYDQVNIVCPLYTNSTKQEDVEQFVIYHVTRDEYDMCRIMNARPHIIAQCNSPYNMRYFTISFRSFSPNPGAIEFRSGKDYYFISTSSKSDLHLRDGGMCRTHNMKLVFKLADGSQQSTQPPLPPPPPPADPPVKPLQDNQLMNFNTPLPPSLNNLEFSADEKKERRRRRKKERQRNSSFYNSQDHNLDLEENEDSKYLNDNPQFRQKEMSQVEKVNNLMKQEASSSIFAGHGSKISAPPPVFLFCSILSSFLLLRHWKLETVADLERPSFLVLMFIFLLLHAFLNKNF